MNPHPPARPAISRRRFLHHSAAASAAFAAPTIIPASALGRAGSVPPSERIVMGAIGIGGRGSHVLSWMMGEPDVRFVAVCDVRRDRRQAVKATIDGHYGTTDCTMHRDLREFLATRTDVDGVLVATGDRWHALASILAMRAGKDVYCEKPSCMTIAEGRAVAETAARYGRVYQTGTQRLSEPNHVFAIEMARSGRLGPLHTTYAHIAPWDAAVIGRNLQPAVPQPPADEVDWDAWLGPCPWRPYHPSYVQGGWRGDYDFHTSCIGEWGAHTFAQVQVAISPDASHPVAYHYVDNPTGDGMVTTFANGVNMILSRGDKYWHGSCGERFDGPNGWVGAADGYSQPDASSPALLAGFKRVVAEYVGRTGRSLNHVRDFFDCVRSRRPAVANASVMHNSMTAVHAANICMWLKRDLRFDPATGGFVNDPEADRLRSRAMREPWTI